MQQKCNIEDKNSTMNTLMKPMHFICGNFNFLDFIKFLSHIAES